MTGPAGRRPNVPGSSRPSGERPPESASFEPIRVSARRSRPPVLVLGFFAVVASIVAIGFGGQSHPAPPAPAAALASPPVPATDEAQPSNPAASPNTAIFRADDGPLLTSAPGLIQISAKRHPATVFVHGDVFVPDVTWVFVSLQDKTGRVAGWASVSVPGAAGPANTGGPTLRFDVELALTADFPDTLWIQVQAYDASGIQIATTRVEVPAPGALSGLIVDDRADWRGPTDAPFTPSPPSRPGPHGQFLESLRPS